MQMETVIVLGVLAVAVVAGMWANTRVRPFAKSEVQGVKLELLISPLLMLTVLLLAFVLVQVFAGFKASKDAAGVEAGRVIHEFELSGYYDDDVALPMQEALVCYARAVTHHEWPLLAGDPQLDPTTTRWGEQLDGPLASLRITANGQPYGTLLTTDKERAEGRRLRLVQAEPAVPEAIQLLLLAISATAILGIAAFTLPYVARRVQLGALIALTLSLGLVQAVIIDMDNKYDGIIQVHPTELELADSLMTPRFEARFPSTPLPCDVTGLPTT